MSQLSSKKELIPTAGQMDKEQRVTNFGTLSPKCLLGTQEGRKSVKARGLDDTKEVMSSRRNRTAHTLCVCVSQAVAAHTRQTGSQH